MTRDEAIARGLTPADTVPSMKRRCVAHDYRAPGVYMLTMEVEERQRLLGRLVGNPSAPIGSPDAPRVELSELGHEVEACILRIPEFYPQVEVWRYVIMEDHLHLLVYVKEPMKNHLGMMVAGFKAGCNKCLRRSPEVRGSMLEARGIVPEATDGSKPALTDLLGVRGIVPEATASGQEERSSLFASGYHDRFLHQSGQLENLKRYIDDNPRRLAVKRQLPNLFRKYLHVVVGSREYAAYGNIFLLREVEKQQVIVHRRDSDHDYELHCSEWMSTIANGGVLVSPFISVREKRVRDMARDECGKLIILKENGFPDFFKPIGWEFDYCAEGKLLLLAPWPHHSKKAQITRAQCLSLNEMATEICRHSYDEIACVKPI